MTNRAIATLIAILAACGGTGGPDAGNQGGADAEDDGSAPVSASCEELVTQWQGIVDGLDNTCTSSADCTGVGGALSAGFPTCNCAPAIGGCWQAVARREYEESGAPTIASEFAARCQEPAICDCGYPERIECVNNRCRVTEAFNCFPQWPPDASVPPDAPPDAPPEDATP